MKMNHRGIKQFRYELIGSVFQAIESLNLNLNQFGMLFGQDLWAESPVLNLTIAFAPIDNSPVPNLTITEIENAACSIAGKGTKWISLKLEKINLCCLDFVCNEHLGFPAAKIVIEGRELLAFSEDQLFKFNSKIKQKERIESSGWETEYAQFKSTMCVDHIPHRSFELFLETFFIEPNKSN